MAIYGSDLNNANKNTCESFCHKPANNLGAAVLATFPPVNPFADFRGQMNLAQFVIFTNVNAATYPGANNAPKNSNMKAQFTNVCTAITKNKAMVAKQNAAVPIATLNIVDTLCQNLLAKVK